MSKTNSEENGNKIELDVFFLVITVHWTHYVCFRRYSYQLVQASSFLILF